ncbi:MAG: hypothetical protein ACKVS7_04150 [Gemmatimonadaceae bacterium]
MRLRFVRFSHVVLLLATLIGAGVACTSPTRPLPLGGRRVLFIGNSLTYTHNLPRTIADLATTVDETPLVYRTVAYPDYALEDHWFADIASDIRADDWQLVVMQQGPSSLLANQEHLRIWSQRLDMVVKEVGARSALYQVWPSVIYLANFDAVRTSYRNAALNVGGMFIPAGEAWQTVWAADSGFAFYSSDGLHASRLGTYMNALVHFEMIYDRPATDLPDVAIVNGETLSESAARVAFMQQKAHETVLAWGIK